jgi:hypothetical protein
LNSATGAPTSSRRDRFHSIFGDAERDGWASLLDPNTLQTKRIRALQGTCHSTFILEHLPESWLALPIQQSLFFLFPNSMHA